jgi:hypothetical protein
MVIGKVNNKKIGRYGKESRSIQKASSQTQVSKKRAKEKETIYQKISRASNTRYIIARPSRRR